MTRIFRRVSAALLLLFGLFCSAAFAATEKPVAIEGLLDLSDWDFQQDGIVALNGDYEFFWMRFLNRHEQLTETTTHYVAVPGPWNGTIIDEVEVSSHGYATYRLNVLIPDNQPKLALKILDFGTAAEVYVDGSRLLEMGRVSERPEASEARFKPTIVEFEPSGQRVELVFHISNYDHRTGGIWLPIMLGEATKIHEYADRRVALELLLFGAIIMIAVFNLALFALRPTNIDNLFLTFFCIIAGTRFLSVNERFLFRIFPDWDWDVVTRIEYLSWYLLIPFLGHFLLQTFPRQTDRKVIYLMDGITAVASFAVLVTPLAMYSFTAPVMQVMTLLSILYGARVLLLARQAHEEGADLMLFGFLFLMACAVNDVLMAAFIIESVSLVNIGVVTFAICHTILASYYFARSLKTVEQQHEQLETTSLKLRTQEKLRHDAELESRKVSDKFRESQHFEALGILAHGVVSELKESVNEAAREVEVLVQSVKSEPNLLASLDKTRRTADRSVAVIEDLLSLSDFDSVEQTAHPNDVVIEMIDASKLKRLMKQRGVQLVSQLSEPIQAIVGSKLHVQRILENLIENAAGVPHPGSVITISTEQTYTDGKNLFYDKIGSGYYVVLSIEDNGPGIHPEDLSYIFQPFFVSQHMESTGRSLGMAVVRAIVRQLGGGIDVVSELGIGTRFDIYLRVALPSRRSS